MFDPKYRITGKVAKALMSIEGDRQVVATLPLTAPILDSLRRTARLLSTHFSTQIEGNKLSPSQVKAVVEGEGNLDLPRNCGYPGKAVESGCRSRKRLVKRIHYEHSGHPGKPRKLRLSKA